MTTEQMPPQIEKECHKGKAQVRQSKNGDYTILCCVGHIIDTYKRWQWPGSVMESRVAFGELFTCYGKMPSEETLIRMGFRRTA